MSLRLGEKVVKVVREKFDFEVCLDEEVVVDELRELRCSLNTSSPDGLD